VTDFVGNRVLSPTDKSVQKQGLLQQPALQAQGQSLSQNPTYDDTQQDLLEDDIWDGSPMMSAHSQLLGNERSGHHIHQAIDHGTGIDDFAELPGIQPSVDEGLVSMQETQQLLEHYRTVVCHMMMPTVDSRRNPWLQLYLPMALEQPTTLATSALLNTLLSVSAYHKARIDTAKSSEYRNAAADYKSTAMIRLDRIISHGPLMSHSPSDRRAMLAAAMSLTTIEVFSGTQEDCHIHIRLARRILKSTGGEVWWKSSLQSSVLYQIFRCYDMVASTVRLRSENIQDAAPDDEIVDDEEDHRSETGRNTLHYDYDGGQFGNSEFKTFDYTQNYTLDTSFGISLNTMALLDKTIRLASRQKSMQLSSAKSVETEIDSLERDLYSVIDDPSLLSVSQSPELGSSGAPSLPSVIANELTENHLWAFHYAVLLFFHRAIRRPNLGRTAGHRSQNTITRAMDAQVIVERTFDHLENIDCLTRDPEMRPANTLWPGFVAACEAIDTNLRHRALIYFARAGSHGIGNISVAKRLVMDVWRRVDRQLFRSGNDTIDLTSTGGLGPIDWRVVMEEMGGNLMLT